MVINYKIEVESIKVSYDKYQYYKIYTFESLGIRSEDNPTKIMCRYAINLVSLLLSTTDY